MKNADVEVILKCVKDSPYNNHLKRARLLRQILTKTSLKGERLHQRSCRRRNSRNAVEHIITYFDNLSAAHRYLSSAATNLSSLRKLVDAETFKMLLHAGVWLLVQLNIPDKFLDPNRDPDMDTSTESIRKKIAQDLLPKPESAALARELDNSPMRLLCAVLWLKLNWMFFNQGTQKEACGLFTVQEKQLSRLLMGCKYFGGTDKRKSMDDGGDDRCSKLHSKKTPPDPRKATVV